MGAVPGDPDGLAPNSLKRPPAEADYKLPFPFLADVKRLKKPEIFCDHSSIKEKTVGTITRVRNVEMVRPKMIATASGRQNSALSAPMTK